MNGRKSTSYPVQADYIGTALKHHFDDLANAPIPDKFLLLLAQLEVREQADKQSDAEKAPPHGAPAGKDRSDADDR